MNARTTVSLAPVLALLLCTCCSSPAPPVNRCGRADVMVSHTFTLEVDPAFVDQVEFHRKGIPMAWRLMEQVAPGKWARSVAFTFGHGMNFRYRFRVHRKDLRRWITISDPRARVLDASPERYSLRVTQTSS